jgi:hypothetical protein
MYQLYRDRPLLVLAMVLANVLLSAWCIYVDPVINNDGVTYLAIADTFSQGEWSKAFGYYSWPFYSLFIAATSKLLFVEVETAAYILNTFFITSLTLAFVCIVAELSKNNRRIILIALVVVLFFPSISKYRSFIIRDFGYLSCYLWSLYFIFRFCSTLEKKHLVGWISFAVLSCLFRFEGIAFLLIAPYFLILFTANNMPHRKKVLGGLSLAITLISVALLYWYLNDKYNALIEIAKLEGQDIQGLSDLFFANLRAHFGEDAAYLNVVTTNLFNVAYELVRRMAVFYFVFAIVAYLRDWALTTRLLKRVWLVFIVTNLAVLVVFSLYNSFLVSRYTMATALTMLILAPFAIDKLWLAFRNRQRHTRYAIMFAFILLALASLNGLNVGTDKTYLKNAGLWMKANIPNGSYIYSNNKLLVHYSALDPQGTLTQLYSDELMLQFIKTKQIDTFDYVALDSDVSNKLKDIIRQTLQFKYGRSLQTFKGEDGNSMLIFEVPKAD